jgi:hypothetical protein
VPAIAPRGHFGSAVTCVAVASRPEAASAAPIVSMDCGGWDADERQRGSGQRRHGRPCAACRAGGLRQVASADANPSLAQGVQALQAVRRYVATGMH